MYSLKKYTELLWFVRNVFETKKQQNTNFVFSFMTDLFTKLCFYVLATVIVVCSKNELNDIFSVIIVDVQTV